MGFRRSTSSSSSSSLTSSLTPDDPSLLRSSSSSSSLPLLHRSSSFLHRSLSRSSNAPRRRPPADVPKGSMAVYVGEQNKRFVIPISYLKHPFVLQLLRQAEEEFGFCPDGAVHLPCNAAVFYSVLSRIEIESPERVRFPRAPMGMRAW